MPHPHPHLLQEESNSATWAPLNSGSLGSHPHPRIQFPCSSAFTDAGPRISTLAENPSSAPAFIALVGDSVLGRNAYV